MEVVLIVLAALALVLISWTLIRKQREKRLEGRREEAGELRQTARRHQLEAERQEAEARALAAQAQRTKAQAAEHEQRAVDVDPDADDDDSDSDQRVSRSFNTGTNGRVVDRGPVGDGTPSESRQ